MNQNAFSRSIYSLEIISWGLADVVFSFGIHLARFEFSMETNGTKMGAGSLRVIPKRSWLRIST
jgi:hypothetical protein